MYNQKHSHNIGIFDSGVGGLTVMRAIMDALPNERIAYFGDTARLPYGNKSPSTIINYSIENTIFLIEKDIKILVVACNTASAFALKSLRKIFKIPVIGVIAPAVKEITRITKTRRIAVLGTLGTINSEVYQQEIAKNLPGAKIFPIRCPLFVPIIEENFLNHPATELIVQEYLSTLKGANVDTILLGCTHYPLLRGIIQKEVGDNVTIIDSAKACAKKVKTAMTDLDILTTERTEPQEHQYFVSDNPDKFKIIAEDVLSISIDNIFSKD